MTDQQASQILAQERAEYEKWLKTPLNYAQWMNLLAECQNGTASCAYVLKKIEAEIKLAVEEERNRVEEECAESKEWGDK